MRWSAVLAGLAAGTIAGCLIELGDRGSCGDGFHDPEWEECDGSDPDSVDGVCEPDEAKSCDPTTCKLVDCDPCDGKECDASLDDQLVDQPTTCEELLVPGTNEQHYAGGGQVSCNDDCTWDRSPCHLCGNGELDALGDESCDGASFRIVELLTACEASCAHLGERIGCRAECTDSCEIEVTISDPACCIMPGNSRSDMLPCCCEMDEPPAYCGSVFVPEDISGMQGMGTCPKLE
jgi:hypothetical protein